MTRERPPPLRLISGTVTGPGRPGFYPCGPMCCRCGARDGREIEEVVVACGCRQCFCDECRMDAHLADMALYGSKRPPLTFQEWIAASAQSCKVSPPHPHVNYAECWAAGLEPTDVREQRDGSLDMCVCGHERKFHNTRYENEPGRYMCMWCGVERCTRWRAP